jgi:hypothetical protein
VRHQEVFRDRLKAIASRKCVMSIRRLLLNSAASPPIGNSAPRRSLEGQSGFRGVLQGRTLFPTSRQLHLARHDPTLSTKGSRTAPSWQGDSCAMLQGRALLQVTSLCSGQGLLAGVACIGAFYSVYCNMQASPELAQCHCGSQAHSPHMAASLGKAFVRFNKQWKALATPLG